MVYMCHILYHIHSVYDIHILLYRVYHWWAFGLVPSLCYCEQCHNKHTCVCFFIIEWLITFGYISSSGIAGLNGISISRSLRNRHTVFHNGWTNLYSHQQCKSIPVSPHPLQRLLSPDFLMIPTFFGLIRKSVFEMERRQKSLITRHLLLRRHHNTFLILLK